jgi:hypothetical protein
LDKDYSGSRDLTKEEIERDEQEIQNVETKLNSLHQRLQEQTVPSIVPISICIFHLETSTKNLCTIHETEKMKENEAF